MIKNTFLFLCLTFLIVTLSVAQTTVKKPLTHSVYNQWKALEKPLISNNGKWVTYEINPQKGDGYIHLLNLQTGGHDSLSRGQEAVFSNSSDLLVFKIQQPQDTIYKLKQAKVKSEAFPKDTLGIRLLNSDSLVTIPRLKSFQIPRDGGAWISYLQEKSKDSIKSKDKAELTAQAKLQSIKDTTSLKNKEKLKKEKEKKKKGAFNAVETWRLTITNPVT